MLTTSASNEEVLALTARRDGESIEHIAQPLGVRIEAANRRLGLLHTLNELICDWSDRSVDQWTALRWQLISDWFSPEEQRRIVYCKLVEADAIVLADDPDKVGGCFLH